MESQKRLLLRIFCVVGSILLFGSVDPLLVFADTTKSNLVKIESLASQYKKEFPDVSEIRVDEANDLVSRKSAVLVDVRSTDEREVSVIAEAISKEQFESRKLAYKDRIVITYCTIGYRSGKYAGILRHEGFDVRNLRGGILAWINTGRPLVTVSGSVTNRVHVYGPKWNLVPVGMESTW